MTFRIPDSSAKEAIVRYATTWRLTASDPLAGLADPDSGAQDGASWDVTTLTQFGSTPTQRAYASMSAIKRHGGAGIQVVTGETYLINGANVERTALTRQRHRAVVTLNAPVGVSLGVIGHVRASSQGIASSTQSFEFRSGLTIQSLTVDGRVYRPGEFSISSASGTDHVLTQAAPVPEPATWGLWAAGLGGLALVRQRRRRRAVVTGRH